MDTYIDTPFTTFTSNLNETQFIKEISNDSDLSILTIDYDSNSGLNKDEDDNNVRITFTTIPSAPQIAAYNALVASHVPIIPEQLNYTHIHVETDTIVPLSSPATDIIDEMTATPQAGTYMITFSASMSANLSTDIIGYGIYKNNILVPSTYRRTSGIVSSVNTTTIAEVNGSDVLTIQWELLAGSSRTCESRTFILLKV